MKTLIEHIADGNALEATKLVNRTLKEKVKAKLTEEKSRVAEEWLGNESLSESLKEYPTLSQYKSYGETNTGDHLYTHPSGYNLVIKKQSEIPNRMKWVHRPGDKAETKGTGISSLLSHLNNFHGSN